MFAGGQQVLPPSSMGYHQSPPGEVIRPPEDSTPSDSMILVDDIGHTITWISPNPVKVNGHFCDVYEGLHVKFGRVALKRPRTGEKGYDDEVVRVRGLPLTSAKGYTELTCGFCAFSDSNGKLQHGVNYVIPIS